jgi:DNA repair exonuclease SbcCD ATPase subunit
MRYALSTLSKLSIVALSLSLGPVAGCDGGERKSIAEQIGPASKNLSEVKTAPTVSEEELQRRRKEAGFVTKEEADAKLAAENAKAFEKGDREYIKARLKEYRALTADTRKLLDDIEKETGKWSAAKDPAKAFAKAEEGLAKRGKDLQKALDKLSEGGVKGGNTQVILNKAFRPLAELIGALGPELGKEAAFPTTLTTIRAALDEAEAAFTEIEKDETLVASKFAEGDAPEDEDEDAAAKKKGK